MKKKIVIFALIFWNVFCYTGLKIHAADTYPYPKDPLCNYVQSDGSVVVSGCDVDPWAFYERECTSYVAWKVNESGLAFSNNMTGPNGQSAQFGNADNWDNAASSIGYQVDTTATAGAIAVWDDHAGYTQVGHVAKVERIDSTGIYISEYNWGYNHLYNERYVDSNHLPDHYIHFNNCGGATVNISSNISSNISCSASSSIIVVPTSILYTSSGSIQLFIK